MTEVILYSLAADGYLRRAQSGESYATTWAAATGNFVRDTYADIIVSQGWDVDGNERISRGMLFFDTSEIPAGTIITSAVFSFWLISKNIHADLTPCSFVLQNGQPDYPSNPLAAGDYNKEHYSGDGGSIANSALVLDQYNDITLNADGRGWINKGGITKFCFRNSHDIAGQAPGVGKYELIQFDANEGDHPPKLTINWEYPALNGNPGFFLGDPNITYGGKGFLLGNPGMQARYFGWLFGNPTMSAELKRYLAGSVAASYDGKPWFLLGSLDSYFGRSGYLQGNITAVPRIPKPSAGQWYMRIGSIIREI